MFLTMTNTMILVKNSLPITKDQMAANFDKKIILGMKSTNMPVSILPNRTKTKSFEVLCVFIANYCVNNEKSEIHDLLWV